MASITTSNVAEVAALLDATRKAALDIQKLGQGKYTIAEIGVARAAEIDANLAALKVALDAVVA